jgi:hypothetical protein
MRGYTHDFAYRIVMIAVLDPPRVFDRADAFASVFGANRGRPAPAHPLFGEWDHESPASKRMERQVRAALGRGEYQPTLDALRTGIVAYGVRPGRGRAQPAPQTMYGNTAVYAARTISTVGIFAGAAACERLHPTLLALLADLGAIPEKVADGRHKPAPGMMATALKAADRDVRRRAHLHLERQLLFPALTSRRVLTSELDDMAFASWWEAVRTTVTRKLMQSFRLAEATATDGWLQATIDLPNADFDDAVAEWFGAWCEGSDARSILRKRLADKVLDRFGISKVPAASK